MKRRINYSLICMVGLAALFLSTSCVWDSSSSGGGSGVQGQGGGFVWKPASESNGKLVVLLPPQYRGKVGTVFVATSNGKPIETGEFAGDTHNGNRPHFRFTRHGSAFGDNIRVVADLNEGGSVFWPIPRGGARTTY